jgi:single-strand DNA-binding protein
MNLVVLSGRLTRDPELSRTATGLLRATIGIAVLRDRKNAKGVRETDTIELVLWQQNAEFARQYLRKGRVCEVKGRLQVREYSVGGMGERHQMWKVVADEIQPVDRRPADVPGESAVAAPTAEPVTEPVAVTEPVTDPPAVDTRAEE